MIRVLLVDDHPLLRARWRQFVEETPDIRVIGEAQSGREALKQVLFQRFDVVVLDLSLPDMGGLAVLRRLQHDHPTLPVLILTMHSEEQYVTSCMRAGASGYVTKADACVDLVGAIRAVAAGNLYESP